MGTLTIRIDNELEAGLAKLAKDEHKTKSEVAREMLRRHLALARLRKLRQQAIPFAEAAGYYTDDDVFRDIS